MDESWLHLADLDVSTVSSNPSRRPDQEHSSRRPRRHHQRQQGCQQQQQRRRERPASDDGGDYYLAPPPPFSRSGAGGHANAEYERDSDEFWNDADTASGGGRERGGRRDNGGGGAAATLILNLANSRFERSALRMAGHPAGRQLTHLNLSQNNLRAIPVDALRPLRALRMLNLSHNFLDSMWGLHHHPALEYLDVSSNWIDHVEGLHRCARLLALDMAQNQIAVVEDVHELGLLERLRVVDLSGNPIAARPTKHLLVRRLLPGGAVVAGFSAPGDEISPRRVPMAATSWSQDEQQVGALTRPSPHVRAAPPNFDRSARAALIKGKVDAVRRRFEDRDRHVLAVARSLPPPLHDRPAPVSRLGPAVVAALRTMRRTTTESVERLRARRTPDVFTHHTDSPAKGHKAGGARP